MRPLTTTSVRNEYPTIRRTSCCCRVRTMATVGFLSVNVVPGPTVVRRGSQVKECGILEEVSGEIVPSHAEQGLWVCKRQAKVHRHETSFSGSTHRLAMYRSFRTTLSEGEPRPCRSLIDSYP